MTSNTVLKFRELGKKIVAVGRNYKYVIFKFYSNIHYLVGGHNSACYESRVRSNYVFSFYVEFIIYKTKSIQYP